MIIMFRADNKYEVYLGTKDDGRILSELEKMGEEELERTEIAIFEQPEGDSIKFALYPDGTYKRVTGPFTSENTGRGVQELKLASAQVLQAGQYDLCGRRVRSYSEGVYGKATARELTPIGVKYTVQKDDGTFFEAYDTDLEIMG